MWRLRSSLVWTDIERSLALNFRMLRWRVTRLVSLRQSRSGFNLRRGGSDVQVSFKHSTQQPPGPRFSLVPRLCSVGRVIKEYDVFVICIPIIGGNPLGAPQAPTPHYLPTPRTVMRIEFGSVHYDVGLLSA